MLQLSNNGTILHNRNQVVLSRGREEEKLVLTLSCKDESDASQVFDRLKTAEDPFKAFQESIWETFPGLSAQISTKYGTVNFSFDSPGFKLPTSPNHIPQPSDLRDPGTGLKLRAGLIRDEISGDVISVGQLDIANLSATNKVCGENFANGLFLKLGELAESHGVNLYRYGGDEFAFTVGGNSEAANLGRINNFIRAIRIERDNLYESLNPEVKAKLDIACEEKRITKNRKFKAEPLDLYVGVASVRNDGVQDQSLLIQQLIGQAEKQVYHLKQTEDRFANILIDALPEPRSSDIQFVENVRKIDRAASKIKEMLSRPDLSIPDRYHLFQELVVVCSEDMALDNGIVRGERFEPLSVYVTQGMENPSYLTLDIPAGILNDTIGPDRTDELFGDLLGSLFVDGSCLTVRTSGGGFKFVFASDRFSERDLMELKEEVNRRLDSKLSATEQNAGLPRGKIIINAAFEA